jgi:replicative DNA helicase
MSGRADAIAEIFAVDRARAKALGIRGYDLSRIDPRDFEEVLREGTMPIRDKRTGVIVGSRVPARRLFAEAEAATDLQHLIDGATWVTGEPAGVPAVWGDDEAVLWAQGEGLMLVGPDGVGKTTLAHQVIRARVGLAADVLGVPVAVSPELSFYIAADRPRQAVRAFNRTVKPDDLEPLRERLIVWRGPLPFDVAADPPALVRFVESTGARTLFIDSLKDVALDLTKDETGSRVNKAFQQVIAAGIELCVLHHQRKEQQGYGKPRRLADVYGSRWLTAGMGSVLLLWGEPGDLIVELSHLKQPSEPFGPMNVIHDHARGVSSVHGAVDVEQAVALRGLEGATAADIARLQTGADTPDRNAIERARRRLEKLVAQGHLRRLETTPGEAVRYVAFEVVACPP